MKQVSVPLKGKEKHTITVYDESKIKAMGNEFRY